MKKSFSITFFLLLAVLVVKFMGMEKPYAASQNIHSAAPISMQVDSKPVVYRPSRVGINLGRWTSWGTQQFSNNILLNPGFEGKIDRIIVIVSESTNKSFSDEAGLGYPDNYWKEAEYLIKSGTSQGKRGVIAKSLNSGENGLPQYFSNEPLPPLQENDVIVLTKVIRDNPLDYWWFNDKELVQFDPYEKRTGSTGSQAIKLSPIRTSRAEMHYYADARASKSGKMLPIMGPWRLSFWAKAESPGAELEISFQRANGSPPLLREVLYPTTEWQEYNLEFKGEDNGGPEYLKLAIAAVRPHKAVWIDDMILQPEGSDDTVFRKAVVEAIKILNPSYLREFAHLGDTWENRIASPFERKSFVYRITGGQQQAIWSYSLQEFLELCYEVHANPWIIVPPTFSDYECKQLGLFLAKNAGKDRFTDVILEFGIENWNWLHRPVGIPYYKEHGEVADRCYEIISKETKNRSPIRFFVNGQYENLENSLNFIDHAKTAEGMAVTPYFLQTLEKATPDENVLEMLFNTSSRPMRQLTDELFVKGKSVAVSEINLHTTEGNAGAYERNRVVAGAASGTALAKKILESMYAGADPILINNLGQFETPTWDIQSYVRLWGVVRDFGPPPLFRPTGLATIMLNRVIEGNMYAISTINDKNVDSSSFTTAAFKTSRSWTAAVISEHDTPIELEIQFPDDGHPLPNTVLTLEADSPFQTNENEENVKIVKRTPDIENRVVKATVPPWGFITLTHNNFKGKED